MNLDTKQQKWLALALLGLVVVLVFSLIISPLFSLFWRQGDRLEQLEGQLERYQRLAGELEQTEQQLQQLSAETPDDNLYLPEQRPALAQAWLQQHLNRQVAQSGGQLVSIQNAPASSDGPLPEVMLRVHLRSELNELVPLIHAIESGMPALFIEDLVITASPRRVRARNNQVVARRQSARVREIPSLDVRFNLLGYTKQEAP
ncbi:type II secretion system protein GspM [Oceanimonas baumannii]|uniref:General secretion pathway protein GspM n=1 Tax=Oceanimonas baumannii TaxID=129578 RepID=A0A235CDQ3_9GAMM|nr:type II secretion system protein GspM [Oceanimonas baumannii]OYD22731.1 general secretion pathway protein GspM [Oceanimonas baumannii]TDW57696.1 general secretion pathway protein M [Oceanimonas baumannii]